MWCPDDIGRDSWDWVVPPAWARAYFNVPDFGGGSSPVKTEPHQIVLLLLCVVCCLLCVVCCCCCCCCCCCRFCKELTKSHNVYVHTMLRINCASCRSTPDNLEERPNLAKNTAINCGTLNLSLHDHRDEHNPKSRVCTVCSCPCCQTERPQSPARN